MSQSVKLVNQGGSTSIHIQACIEESGNLVISGQDIGDAPEEFFGDLDYEYWLTVPAAEKDQLLLALIEKHYAGDLSVVSTLRDLMKSKGIPCNFHSY